VDEAYLDMSGLCQAETLPAALKQALPLAKIATLVVILPMMACNGG
jgi:hypothetical protein